jgi:hypothetical protein
VKFTGEEIPAEAYILVSGSSFKMKKESTNSFSYRFNLLQTDVAFRINTGVFNSEEYLIRVFPRPIILNFDIRIDYPGYLRKAAETVENTGDLVIPEGTTLTWRLFTKDVNTVNFSLSGKQIALTRLEGNRFEYSSRFSEGTSYSVSPVNEYTYKSDSIQYKLSVVKDGFPSIFVSEMIDSNLAQNIFFNGTIKDDYGFTKLAFNYEITDNADTTLKRNRTDLIVIDNAINNQSFYYSVDMASLLKQPGQIVKYYFEVFDNDGLHGAKSARSEVRVIKTLTLEESIEQTDLAAEDVRKKMESSLSESKAMKKTIDEMNRKMVDQSTMSWKEKKQLEELLKINERIIENVEQVKKKNQENLRNEEKYLETSERIKEKQNQLNELMEKMFTEDMKKMMEEMKEMLNKVDKNKLQDLMEKMKMSGKELEQQLDQNIELYKQIEFERKLEESVSELRKTAAEQEKLASGADSNKRSIEEVSKAQEELNRKFDSIKGNLDKLSEEGKKLETPVNIAETKALQDSIGKKMKESLKNLEGKKKKPAAKSQKEAAEKMKELANDLEEMQQETEEEQMEEDVTNLRMILENLLRLSFDQEALIVDTRLVSRTDPRFQEIIIRQKEIMEKLKGVEDSLRSIAKRQVFIQPVISKEIAAINSNIQLSLESLDQRNIANAIIRQQYTMTSINNLANLLSEAKEKMDQQMQSNMKTKGGQKSCSKPSGKGGKASAKNIRELQQKLGEQLDKMKKGMQKQGKEGKGSKGEQSAMNQELARMAAQQEALRGELQKYQESLLEEGKKDGGALNKTIGEMEETEKDIINKRISAETMNRQQRIVTRLLESEKAEQIREQEEKREATEAKSTKVSNQKENYQYKKINEGSQEILQLSDIPLSTFYRNRVNSYLLKITH